MDDEKVACAFRFARVLVIFSLALVCILRRVFEQLVNSRAVTISHPPMVVLDRMLLALTHHSMLTDPGYFFVAHSL